MAALLRPQGQGNALPLLWHNYRWFTGTYERINKELLDFSGKHVACLS